MSSDILNWSASILDLSFSKYFKNLVKGNHCLTWRHNAIVGCRSRKRSGLGRHHRRDRERDRDKHHSSASRNPSDAENVPRSRSSSADQNAQRSSPTSPAGPDKLITAGPSPAEADITKANRQSQLFTSDLSPAVIAQANWTFVETMLSVSTIPITNFF